MASPAVYLADSIAVGLFLFLCCDDGAWMLGKIMKYKRKAKKFNFDVQWRTNTTQQHGVELAKYFFEGETAAAGSWRYLKKLPRSRVRARENDEHEDGGGADAQGRRRIDHEEQQMEEG